MSIFGKKEKLPFQCKYCGYIWKENDQRSIIQWNKDMGPVCAKCFDRAFTRKKKTKK